MIPPAVPPPLWHVFVVCAVTAAGPPGTAAGGALSPSAPALGSPVCLGAWSSPTGRNLSPESQCTAFLAAAHSLSSAREGEEEGGGQREVQRRDKM